MIQYIVAGLVLGGAYALTSATLVMTFTASGILNFAFGAIAFSVARFFYFVHSEHHWNIWPSALLSIVVLGPLLGVALWAVLFRQLQKSTPLIKVVSTIGLSVAIPAVAIMIFGNKPILSSPGLAPLPIHVFRLLGVAITADQMIVFAAALILGICGLLILRFTDVGLAVRAVVNSEAMASLAGTNPQAVSVGVWAASTFVAGLVGVLLAPIVGLAPGNYTTIMVTAFAAVVCARLRNLGRACLFGIGLGVATALITWKVPADSQWLPIGTAAVPFIFIMLALVYYHQQDGNSIGSATGGALDRAIRPVGHAAIAVETVKPKQTDRIPQRFDPLQNLRSLTAVIIVAILPLILSGFWIGLVGLGVAFGIAFLSYTLVAGEGGMIWLCQITFAGIGAVLTAQLTTRHGWPVLASIFVGALATVPIGLLLGWLTVRLGSLYVALVTLSFGLLVDQVFFNLSVFDQLGVGVVVGRPSFAGSQASFLYLALAVFCVVASLIFVLRHSTAGLGLTAVRYSETGARSIGIRVVLMKVAVAGAAAFVAGLGGGFIACYSRLALPSSFAAIGGLVWLAVLVSTGVRSSIAALIAGVAFSLLPGVFLVYVPSSLANVPAALFGLGAIMVINNPDGVLATQVSQARGLLARCRGLRHTEGYGSGRSGTEVLAEDDSDVSPTGLRV